MSRWVEGKTYDYYGTPIVCARRWFNGPMEMVDLRHAQGTEVCVRTARLGVCMIPKVTETLGGVTAPLACHHDWYSTVVADAGPYAGQTCCTACGTPRVDR